MLDHRMIRSMFWRVAGRRETRDGNIELAKICGDTAAVTLAAAGFRVGFAISKPGEIVVGVGLAAGLAGALRLLVAIMTTGNPQWTGYDTKLRFLRISSLVMMVWDACEVVGSGAIIFGYCLIMNVLIVLFSYFATFASSSKGRHD